MVIYTAEYYFSEHDSALTCIDFDIDVNFNLVVNHACINVPFANVEVLNGHVNWHFTPQKTLFSLQAVQASTVNITAKPEAFLFDAKNGTAPRQNLPRLMKQWPGAFGKEVRMLLGLLPPFTVDITDINYLAKDEAKSQVNAYKGTLSIHDNKLATHVVDNNNQKILSVLVERAHQQTVVTSEIHLAPLQQIIMHHLSAFPDNINFWFNNQLGAVSGLASTEMVVTEQNIVINNKLTKLVLRGGTLLNNSSITEVLAGLNWQTRIHANRIEMDFNSGDNSIYLTAKQPINFAPLINHVNKKTAKILADNPIKLMQLELSGIIDIDLVAQKISLDNIGLISQNLSAPLTLSVNNIVLNYQQNSALGFDLEQLTLAFDGLANVSQIHHISKKPVRISLAAHLKQQPKTWVLTLKNDSSIEVDNIHYALVTKNSNRLQKPSVGMSAKSLFFAVNGQLSFAKHQLHNAVLDNVDGALTVIGKANQFKLGKVVYLSELTINTQLNSTARNFEVKSNMSSAGIEMASAHLRGDLESAMVSISASEVLLPDLLALNGIPHEDINLIDGQLSYRIDGKITDTNTLKNNRFNVAIILKEVSGEVKGHWLQGVNWQQKVMIENNHIKSIVAESELPPRPNLTVAKIESATTITQFAGSIVLDSPLTRLAIAVNDISGNVLGGKVELNQVNWPFLASEPIKVRLTEIDLEKLFALDPKQGIVVTGNISGYLPMYYDGYRPLIKDGHLYNVGGGIIQVSNNPSVQALTADNTQLKLAFDALQNLHYHHLSSDVVMADDGYMKLLTAIEGHNPDIQNDVNLNVNLSYDLLGLLESLTITEQFENEVLNGLQN